MARDVDYDVDLFAEMVRSGKFSDEQKKFSLEAGGPLKRTPRNKDLKKDIE